MLKQIRINVSHEFSQHSQNELYDKYGDIMYLICIKGKCDEYNWSRFELSSFIKTITNRESQNVIQRAKLLKVEVIQCNKNEIWYEHLPTPLKLKITVSSPHIFQRLFQHQTSLIINNMTFKYEIPEMYNIQSQIHSLNLCIRPFSASQGYVLSFIRQHR